VSEADAIKLLARIAPNVERGMELVVADFDEKTILQLRLSNLVIGIENELERMYPFLSFLLKEGTRRPTFSVWARPFGRDREKLGEFSGFDWVEWERLNALSERIMNLGGYICSNCRRYFSGEPFKIEPVARYLCEKCWQLYE